MQIVASYKSLEALGMIETTPAPKNRGKHTVLEKASKSSLASCAVGPDLSF